MEMRRSAGERWVTSRPPMVIVPESTSSSPAISRRVVDLPHPEGPRRTRSVPASALKLIRSTPPTPPQDFDTALTTISDMSVEPMAF